VKLLEVLEKFSLNISYRAINRSFTGYVHTCILYGNSPHFLNTLSKKAKILNTKAII